MSPPTPVRAYRVAVADEHDAPAEFDYASTFAVLAGQTDRTAEQWARAMFEGAPAPARRLLVIGWILGLRLALGPRPSPDHVLGWRILAEEPDSIVLELRSPLLTARKVLRTEQPRVLTTTFVHCERRLGRVLWLAVAPVHHRTEPYLLGHAASHATASRLPS